MVGEGVRRGDGEEFDGYGGERSLFDARSGSFEDAGDGCEGGTVCQDCEAGIDSAGAVGEFGAGCSSGVHWN